MVRGVVLLMVLLGPTPTSGAQPYPTERCPQLFGDQQAQELNRKFRRRYLRWTQKEPSGITVTHTNVRWERIKRLRFKGLSIESRGGETLVQISRELADNLGCASGRYRLERDDALGGQTRALALLGEVVLVAHRGKLAFLAVEGRPSPRWLLAWQLPGATVRRRATSPGRPPPPRPKPPPAKTVPRKR